MKKPIITILVLMILQSLSAQDFRKLFSDTTLIKNNLWQKERSSYYTNFVDEEDSDFSGYFQRGIKKLEDSLFSEAIIDFKKSITEDRRYTENIPSLDKNKGKNDALFYIGLSFASLKNNDSAFFYFNKTIESNPHYLDAYYQMASLYGENADFDEMEDILKKGIGANPNSPEMKYQLGIVYLFDNNKSKVKRIQKQLVDEFPNYEDAYTLLGIIYLLEGKFNSALFNLNKSIEINPENAYTYILRGAIYTKLEDYLNLYKDLSKSYQIDSSNFPNLISLAVLDIKYGNDSIGLKRVYQHVNAKFIDTIQRMTVNPKSLEYYHLMKVITADTLPPLEMTYIKSFFYDYYWGGKDQTKKDLDEYLSQFPNSEISNRFWLYVHIENQFEEIFKMEFDSIQNKYVSLTYSYPEEGILWFLLGEQYSLNEKPELSIDTYKKGLRFMPLYAFAYTAIAHEFSQLQKYDSTVFYYSKAIDIYPDYLEAHYFRAQTLSEIPGRMKDAIIEYNRILELDISKHLKKEITLGLATCYAKIEQYDSAIIYLDKLLEEDKRNTDLLEKRGYAYLQMQQYDKAIKCYDKALKEYNSNYYKSPQRVRSYFDRGNAYYYKEQYYLAINDYREALNIQPKDPIFKGALGDCYRNLGDTDRAIKNYEKAIEGVPDNQWYHYKKAICHKANYQYLESIMSLTNAILIDSSFSEAYAHIGWNYYKLEKYKLSIHFSNEALKYDPTSNFASFNIALSFLRLGYYDKACEIFSHINSNKDQIDNSVFEACIIELKELLYIQEFKKEARQILEEIFLIQV